MTGGLEKSSVQQACGMGEAGPLACILHTSAIQDTFDVTLQDIKPSQSSSGGGPAFRPKVTGDSLQVQPGAPLHREGICRLFNRH